MIVTKLIYKLKYKQLCLQLLHAFYFTLMDEMWIFSYKICHLCVLDKPGLLFSAEDSNYRRTTCHDGISCFLLPNDTHE